MSFTRAQIEAHNARVAAEAVRAAEKRQQHDNPTRTEIPNAEQRKRPVPLARSSEGEAQGAKGVLASPIRGFCTVSFLLRRVRLLDVDAATASVKDVLDCCWISKLVDGDRPDQISLEVKQEKVASFKEEETIVEISMP